MKISIEMKVQPLRKYSKEQSTVLHYNDSLRETFSVKLLNVRLTGRNIHYPNCLLYHEGTLVSPYDERVMSLQRDSFYDNDEWIDFVEPRENTIVETPCFFFSYNVDNYYHFIYDSLPILHAYFKIKETVPSLTLLIQTSHPSKKQLPIFVNEFLSMLWITDWLLSSSDTTYKTLYVASSLTHGGQSNEKPSPDAYPIWQRLCPKKSFNSPSRIYISRRSWVHGDTSNMGTNYTTRRKCENEDALVELLEKYNIQEVFTELLSTEEKITMFQHAELVVGIIGGGMANLLFSPSQTKSLCITTPYFLEINQRFKHSMDHTIIRYSECSSHTHVDWIFKPYSRVKVSDTNSSYHNRVGEVTYKEGDNYYVALSSNDVAGFSQDFQFETVAFHKDTLIAVDHGLNSPFEVNITQLELDLKLLLETKQ